MLAVAAVVVDADARAALRLLTDGGEVGEGERLAHPDVEPRLFGEVVAPAADVVVVARVRVRAAVVHAVRAVFLAQVQRLGAFVDAEERLLEQDGTRATTWLQPYGWGDGGGGPDEEQIMNAELAGRSAAMPTVDVCSATEFCRRLHAEFDTESPPVWDGDVLVMLRGVRSGLYGRR